MELLVVITIAAMLAAIALPRMMGTVAHVRLRASAERLAITLRETRSAAMRSSQRLGLLFSAASDTAPQTGVKIVSSPSGQRFTFQPFGRAAVDHPVLEFLPDGTSSGGTITIAGGAYQVRVEIDWLTGRIMLHD